MYYVEGFTVPDGKRVRVHIQHLDREQVTISIKAKLGGTDHLFGCTTDKYTFRSMVAQKRPYEFEDGHYAVRAQPIEVDGRDYYDLTFLFLGHEHVTVRVEQDGLLLWLNL